MRNFITVPNALSAAALSAGDALSAVFFGIFLFDALSAAFSDFIKMC